MIDQLSNNVMSLFGLSKGQKVKSDMDHFKSLSKEKQNLYQKKFSSIAESDLNTNKLGSWTSPYHRWKIYNQFADAMHNYFGTFNAKLSNKTQETIHKAEDLKNQT